jgi:hypothetical protein
LLPPLTESELFISFHHFSLSDEKHQQQIVMGEVWGVILINKAYAGKGKKRRKGKFEKKSRPQKK